PTVGEIALDERRELVGGERRIELCPVEADLRCQLAELRVRERGLIRIEEGCVFPILPLRGGGRRRFGRLEGEGVLLEGEVTGDEADAVAVALRQLLDRRGRSRAARALEVAELDNSH